MFGPPDARSNRTQGDDMAGLSDRYRTLGELATELANLDVPVGSRLSTTVYDAPDNASISKILINTARRAPSSGRAVTE